MSAVAEPDAPKPKRSNWSVFVEVIVGLVLGAGLMWAYFSHAQVARWADAVALCVALICAIAATRIFIRSLDAKKLGELMAVEGASTPREASQARLQALVLALLGLVMVWPPLMTMSHWPAPLWSYAVIAAFLIVRLAYTNHVFQKGDEFVRQNIRVSAWRAFFLGQTLLIAYAGGERLGLWPQMNSWDVLVVMTALSILAPAFNVERRARV
jgi:hypothetical protein